MAAGRLNDEQARGRAETLVFQHYSGVIVGEAAITAVKRTSLLNSKLRVLQIPGPRRGEDYFITAALTGMTIIFIQQLSDTQKRQLITNFFNFILQKLLIFL